MNETPQVFITQAYRKQPKGCRMPFDVPGFYVIWDSPKVSQSTVLYVVSVAFDHLYKRLNNMACFPLRIRLMHTCLELSCCTICTESAMQCTAIRMVSCVLDKFQAALWRSFEALAWFRVILARLASPCRIVVLLAHVSTCVHWYRWRILIEVW